MGISTFSQESQVDASTSNHTPQTHFISNDPAGTLAMKLTQPLHTGLGLLKRENKNPEKLYISKNGFKRTRHTGLRLLMLEVNKKRGSDGIINKNDQHTCHMNNLSIK